MEWLLTICCVFRCHFCMSCSSLMVSMPMAITSRALKLKYTWSVKASTKPGSSLASRPTTNPVHLLAKSQYTTRVLLVLWYANYWLVGAWSVHISLYQAVMHDSGYILIPVPIPIPGKFKSVIPVPIPISSKKSTDSIPIPIPALKPGFRFRFRFQLVNTSPWYWTVIQ